MEILKIKIGGIAKKWTIFVSGNLQKRDFCTIFGVLALLNIDSLLNIPYILRLYILINIDKAELVYLLNYTAKNANIKNYYINNYILYI
jgi:hypothetical protein